jgi:integrase
MIFTGSRPGALLGLKRSKIVFDKKRGLGKFPIKKLKGGKLETVTFQKDSAIHMCLRLAGKVFEDFRGRKPNRKDLLFVTKWGRSKTGGWTCSGFSHAVRRYADIAARKFASESARKFVAYDSRHSILTWLAREGVSDELRAKYVGHASTAMQKVYVHTSGEDAKEQRRAVDGMLGKTFERSMDVKKLMAERLEIDDAFPALQELVISGI